MANGWTGNILESISRQEILPSKIPVNLKVLSVAWASATKLCMTKYRQAQKPFDEANKLVLLPAH